MKKRLEHLAHQPISKHITTITPYETYVYKPLRLRNSTGVLHLAPGGLTETICYSIKEIRIGDLPSTVLSYRRGTEACPTPAWREGLNRC